ncbi:MAG: 30S ribosomal protein S13 [Candidatus Omnitrophica bacterium]|nr:30S ribosomal protein S13 [Candidatus Omnitrophota bacterium]HOX54740.1 30S ribosomal protein S13 [Candidatus Omnitrophota bacterium]
MPRILGLDLPKDKRIEISLTYFYGIGRTLSNKILKDANIDPNKRAKDLSEEEISKIAALIQKNYRVEGDLKREIAQNVKRLIDIGSYRGSRHRRGLPARGQRTRTNARTRKGPKKNVGIMKAAAEKPAAA